jgi:predicted methyltransferase
MEVSLPATNDARRTWGRVATLLLGLGASGVAAGWILERYDETRLFEREAERIATVLAVRPGINVGDVRAGTGKWTVDLARRIGPTGQVYATVGPNPPHELYRTLARAGVDNVTVITRTPGPTTPRLPLACCDAILVRAVYHEFRQQRDLIIRNLWRNLKPGGRLLVIDFDQDTPEYASGHGIALRTVLDEMTSVGFEVVETIPDWNGHAYAVLFRRPF